MIAIIDYDAGNLKSVEKALAAVGQESVITRDFQTILSADKVILPGVGSFGAAMENLEKYGLVELIHEIVEKNTPFLGICLGLQLLFEESEESPGVKGLGILKGKKAICYPGMEEGLIGAEVTCQPAVTDGHITTSRGLGTAIDFALALISELRDKESADTISKQVVYER